MVYHFHIHQEGSGYWTECVELTGCVTEADSLDEPGIALSVLHRTLGFD